MKKIEALSALMVGGVDYAKKDLDRGGFPHTTPYNPHGPGEYAS